MDTPHTWVTNADALAVTGPRRDALALVNAGLDAIETTHIISQNVSLEHDTLHIGPHSLDLAPFKRICLVGFGKVACQASQELKRILGARISPETVITSAASLCEHPEHLPATHPLPSAQNVAHTETLMNACEDLRDDDLVLVIVSGGGSAMLCGSLSECDQGQRLYGDALKSGMTIRELNVVRKHISELKGGGMAKALYPAHVIGLIFSDVPGTAYDMVASGPTWPDPTTVQDAQHVLERYGLDGYTLQETPKESRWFERVTNIVLASNRIALEAMARHGTALGYAPHILSDALYLDPAEAITQLYAHAHPRSVILAGGEFRLVVSNGGKDTPLPAKLAKGGPPGSGEARPKGGRNTSAALTALETLDDRSLFVAFASDGLDNSDAAGAIADMKTKEKARAQGLDAAAFLERFASYHFFQKTGDLLFTGPTEANVSDLMFLLTE